MTQITYENRSIILEKYINFLLNDLNISKEVNLYICQRIMQNKNLLSNEFLEQEILKLCPYLLNNNT
jgi:hypothetical protein